MVDARIRDAVEILDELLKEIRVRATFSAREKSIVSQLETVRGVLAEIQEESKPARARWLRAIANGTVLVWYPDDNVWGFSLSDGENSWAGGGDSPASSAGWTWLEEDDPSITPEQHAAMDWLFNERHDDGTGPRKAWYEN